MEENSLPKIVPFESDTPELIDAPVSSDLDKFVARAEKIAHAHPEILCAIEHDQKALGLKKKALRLADQAYLEAQNPPLPNLNLEPTEPEPPTGLEGGRPRMPALAVFVLMLLRGWLGGPKSVNFRLVLRESITLRQFFKRQDMEVPGPSTVADNINAVSHATQQLILRCQLQCAKEEKLEDFSVSRIDSTASEANSKYPTDSGLIAALAMRMIAFFKALAKLGLPDFSQRAPALECAELVREIEVLSKQIGMISGKQGVKEKRANWYKKIYSRVERLVKKIEPLYQRAFTAIEEAQVQPSKRQRLEALGEQAKSDRADIAAIGEYSAERVLEGKTIVTGRKVLSVCDQAAAIIIKGGWDTILGFRPQLAFSGKGLVAAHHLPEGNANDAGQLEEVLQAVVDNTETAPAVVTVDDGYANGPVRERFIEKHSNAERPIVFSVAGAKGRAIIDEETYDSEAYRNARHDRSAAESCIYALKAMHDYGEVMRRGIQAVRHEQMCKVLAYNVRRIVRLEEDSAKALKKQLLEKQKARLQLAA